MCWWSRAFGGNSCCIRTTSSSVTSPRGLRLIKSYISLNSLVGDRLVRSGSSCFSVIISFRAPGKITRNVDLNGIFVFNGIFGAFKFFFVLACRDVLNKIIFAEEEFQFRGGRIPILRGRDFNFAEEEFQFSRVEKSSILLIARE